MNYFRYKQFNKDVITVGYYLRYALSYRDISEILRNVVSTFIIQRSTVGFKNMLRFVSNLEEKHKKRIISGVLMRHISKLKDSGVICIARLMQMDIH